MNHTPQMFRTARNVTLAGAAGLICRILLYRLGPDAKGLLPRMHPLHLLCLVLTAAVGGYLIRTLRRQDSVHIAGENRLFRLPLLCAGALLVVGALSLAQGFMAPLTMVRLALTFAAAMAIFTLASGLLRSHTGLLALHGTVTIYFLADMLARYRIWSGNPQLPDYVFQVLACVCLVLCSYFRLAELVDLGKPRIHSGVSLMALYLCLLGTVGPESWTFYLAGAIWAGAGIFALPCPKDPEEA